MNSPYRETVLKITNGVCKNLTDLLLYLFFLTSSSIGKQGPRGVYEAFREADEMLETINYQTIISALKSLKRKKAIQIDKQKSFYISSKTYEKLKKETELFRRRRLWSGKIYLILYDIPISGNKKRWLLRKFLISIGSAKLQDSSYISFYNPKSQLRDFINKYNIPGVVLVTEMSKDSSIGEEPLSELINRVYNLENLNKKYQAVWDFVKHDKYGLTIRLKFRFLELYKSDPKLPYELLPKPWYGLKLEDYFKKNLER